MHRFTYAGLVPCPPDHLAHFFLDLDAAPGIWPALGRRTVLRSGDGWLEVATPELGGTPGRPAVRMRLLNPTEVIVTSAGPGAIAHHRFVPAEGGCLWVIDNLEERPRGEAWSHFARRRRRAREEVEGLVDGAAAHFAARA